VSRKERTPETCAGDLSIELAEAKMEGHSTIRRYLGTLIDDSGWQKRSSGRVARLNAALLAEGLTASINITDLTLSLDTWVKFARSPFAGRPVAAQFKDEQAFNEHLREHYTAAFAGITGLEGARLVGSEEPVEYGDQQLFVDLVFEMPDGTMLIVELEKGEPPGNAVMQLRTYLNAYRQKGVSALRGILITGDPRSAQHELDILNALEGLAVDYQVEWYQYRLGVSLERAD
jgi:hypothetical protein